jgi:ABC-type protease/lipase transport system fused ATPase/permease subunit
MSFLLHIAGKLLLFTVLAVVVLTLLTWFTKTKSEQTMRPSSGENQEDKATRIDRTSAWRPASSRRDTKKDHERWRA